MQQSARKNRGTVAIKISTPLANLKNIKVQVVSNVCALLNSSGGDLIIYFPDQTYRNRDLEEPVKRIEQWISKLIGITMMSKNVELKVGTHQILIAVKGSYYLVTVDYNMFLPSHAQVNQVQPIETLEKIQDVVFGKEMLTSSNELPVVQQVFIKGEEMKSTETYSVQYKLFQDAPDKPRTLADRVTAKSNKVLQCVTAFANYHGGTIYIGVDDEQHLIKGQFAPKDEIESIIKKVTIEINKIIWLGLKDGPSKGKNWDIHFYPVVDKDGKSVESTFVIVIVVARCPGGVFFREPESYNIVNGCVEKMHLDTWKEYLLSKLSYDQAGAVRSTNAESTLAVHCPRLVGRSQWSSNQSRKKYDYVNGVLIRMVNDGLWDEFLARAEKEKASCRLGGVRLAILLVKITADYKKGDFEKAQDGIEEYRSRLSQSEDVLISETREFLLRSSLERCKGNIPESYEQAQKGLSLVEQIPPGIVAGEYYVNIATVITILLEMETDAIQKQILRGKAIFFFQLADEHLDYANDYLPSKFDQKQKVHINLAFLHLGCSFASDPKAESRVDDAAIQKATNSLNVVDYCVNEGYPLSDYRNCQFLLVRAVLFYRRSQNLKADETERREQLLKSALNFSNKAKKTANDGEFEEMLKCTSKHIEFFNSPSDCSAECMVDT